MNTRLHTSDDAAIRQLSTDELDLIAGGEWSWRKFIGAVGAGVFGGGMSGAAVGGIGAGLGAVGGGLLGGIGYCITEIFD